MITFKDTFTDVDFTALADHTPDVGTGWSVHPAHPDTPVYIDSGWVISSHSNRIYLSDDPGTDDYLVHGSLKLISTSDSAGVVARSDPGGLHKMYGLTYKSGVGFELWKWTTSTSGNIVKVILSTVNPATVNDGDHDFILTVNGSQIDTLIIDRTNAFPRFLRSDGTWTFFPFGSTHSASDSDLTSGKPGIYLTSSYLIPPGNQVNTVVDKYKVIG